MFDRELYKEEAEREIMHADYCPTWHPSLKQGDVVAFYHSEHGWCKAKILSECKAQMDNVEEVMIQIMSVLNSSQGISQDIECISK